MAGWHFVKRQWQVWDSAWALFRTGGNTDALHTPEKRSRGKWRTVADCLSIQLLVLVTTVCYPVCHSSKPAWTTGLWFKELLMLFCRSASAVLWGINGGMMKLFITAFDFCGCFTPRLNSAGEFWFVMSEVMLMEMSKEAFKCFCGSQISACVWSWLF